MAWRAGRGQRVGPFGLYGPQLAHPNEPVKVMAHTNRLGELYGSLPNCDSGPAFAELTSVGVVDCTIPWWLAVRIA